MNAANQAVAPEILSDENHIYSVRGIVRPSVTQILSLSGLANFDAIPECMRSFVLARGRATHQAGHFLLEADLDESTLDPEVAPRIQALKSFLFHSGFEPLPGMIEQRVFSERYGFAGTFDCLGRLPALNGRVALVDWKNCHPDMSGTRYQMAAYLLCIKDVHHRAAITLRADGNFSVTTYSPLTLYADQMIFLRALNDLRTKGMLHG